MHRESISTTDLHNILNCTSSAAIGRIVQGDLPEHIGLAAASTSGLLQKYQAQKYQAVKRT